MPPISNNTAPSYKLVSGANDDAFCNRVSEALAEGYQLYGSPIMAIDGNFVVVAQAMLLNEK